MNKQITIGILLVAILSAMAFAHAPTVTIEQPVSSSIHLDDDVLLKAKMDDNGTIKYKLDINSEIVVCNNCSSFQVTLNNLANGQHTVKVTGLAHENETDDATVAFTVNKSQQEQLSVTIQQPVSSSIHLDDDVILRASMNLPGLMKYKLDSNAEITACSSCSNFQATLNDLSDGQHTVKVTGISGNQSDDASVTFKVNETETNDNKTDKKFAKGFEKLPQQFASGEITEAELKFILEANRLPPGVINRLAKTGKLTPSLIDTIIGTQFLPAGIAGKLLGVLGFGKNKAFNTLLKEYNLTESQLAKLIENSELPQGAIKKLIKELDLSSGSIDSLLTNQDLRHGTIKQLIESQTLTPANVQNIIDSQDLNKKIVLLLIKQQLLDNQTIAQLKQFGNGKLQRELDKFQSKQDKEEDKADKAREMGKEKDEDDDNEGPSGRKQERNKGLSLGKQKGRGRD